MRFVDSIIGKEAIGWYNFEGKSTSIEEYFNSGVEYSPEKDSRRFRGIDANMSKFEDEIDFQVTDNSISFGDVKFDHVRRQLQKVRGERLSMYVCHGDLNSNNVMVFEGESQFSLIDFEYTGNDSVYKDFISLESSLRVHFPVHVDVLECEKWTMIEHLLFDECASFGSEFDVSVLEEMYRPYFDSILTLRRKMAVSLGEQGLEVNWGHYLFALAFHLMKLAALENWDRDQFMKLLFSYLSCLSILDKT